MKRVQKDTRALLFETMAKINPDFKRINEEFSYEPDLNMYEEKVQKIKAVIDKLFKTQEFDVIDTLYRLMVERTKKTPMMVREHDSPEYQKKAELLKGKIDFLFDGDHYDILDKIEKIIDGLFPESETEMNEISTGLAQKASGAAGDKYFTHSGNNDTITARKRDYQNAKFSSYINPELRKYIMKQFADIPNLEVYKDQGNTLVLKFPRNEPNDMPMIKNVTVNIDPNGYYVAKGTENQFGRIDYSKGGEGYLPQNVITRLPNIIKRIQADMRGEKSMFNPTKPIQQEPEPIQEPVQQTSEPVTQEKPSGIFGKIKNKFGRNE